MYYKIEGYAYRTKGNEKNLVYIEQVFKNEEPCVARQKCFDAYMSYLDVFYMSIGKEYTTHDQAEKDLKDFLVKGKNTLTDEFDFGNFIDIKFIFDEKEHNFKAPDNNGELLIHSLSGKNSNLNKAMCLEGLQFEYQFYESNGYFCGDNMVKDKKGNKIFKSLIDYSQFEYDEDIS